MIPPELRGKPLRITAVAAYERYAAAAEGRPIPKITDPPPVVDTRRSPYRSYPAVDAYERYAASVEGKPYTPR